ncbi:MAG TPA: Fis family transcriptional regulator [Cyanobacteria bacterium UBA8530]|nr:Fis family transcriptional regulator [Cyanobacteria bacterium UBA8530]
MNHLVPTRCPICSEALEIVRLECDSCGSALEGRFSLGWLGALSREQIQFIQAFLKCRGKIKDVEQELGISYPTVVARLSEVVQAMGFEAPPETDDFPERRQKTLDDLAAGKIDATEAADLLRGMAKP